MPRPLAPTAGGTRRQGNGAQSHEAGVRGIRFNLYTPGTTTIDMVRPLAGRVATLGWHVQVNVKGGKPVGGMHPGGIGQRQRVAAVEGQQGNEPKRQVPQAWAMRSLFSACFRSMTR